MENKKVASVAERLREALSDAGKTQADLMRETGLQRSAISRYLAGSYEPKAKAVGEMARVLLIFLPREDFLQATPIFIAAMHILRNR